MAKAVDVVVIGGGVNGCGVARDLAKRGLSVTLVDKGDLALGTSWASSGMIHGGMRYLLNDVGTTKKSCKDSGYIQQIAAHMLFRIPLVMPFFKSQGWKGRLKMEGANALVSLYDRYQPLKRGKPSLRLSADEVRRLEPAIREDVVGAISLDEWGLNVPRLCVMNALDAADHGATIRTWTQVTDFLRDEEKVVGVVVYDQVDKKKEEIRARMVVNCAGPWAPEIGAMAGATLKLRPAKGVHLVLDRRVSNIGMIAEAIDGRGVFVIPHENVSVIGTTDDDYYGDLDDIPVLEDEIEYLWQAIESVIPTIRQARVVKTIAGVRPTLFERAKYEDDLTRDHQVVDHAEQGMPGMVSLLGGKLAAYRVMAEDAADTVCRHLGNKTACRTHLDALPGGRDVPDAEALSREFGLDAYLIQRMIARQGIRSLKILDMIRENPALGYLVCQCEPVTEAELRFVIRTEHVRRAVDLIGRCHIGEGPCQGMGCIMQAAIIFGQERGLSPQQVAEEAVLLMQEKWRWRRTVLDGPQLANEELYRMVMQAIASPDRLANLLAEVY
jgi:glycerol-3-phosphate dehydrogenase